MTPADLKAMIGASTGTIKQGDTLVFSSKADLEIVFALRNKAPAIAALWEAAQEYLDAQDAWAKAQAAASVAADNFSNPNPELDRLEAALVRASRAEKALRAALAGMGKE